MEHRLAFDALHREIHKFGQRVRRAVQHNTRPVSYTHLLAEPYTPAELYAAVKGLEDIPEGGRRCYECYRLRLRRAAQAAAAGGYDYFTTTLSDVYKRQIQG